MVDPSKIRDACYNISRPSIKHHARATLSSAPGTPQKKGRATAEVNNNLEYAVNVPDYRGAAEETKQ